jgi:hypothetical protein
MLHEYIKRVESVFEVIAKPNRRAILSLQSPHRASLPDPNKLFNAGLEGNAWRAIDFVEGDEINERALKNLVRAAVDYNHIKLRRVLERKYIKVESDKTPVFSLCGLPDNSATGGEGVGCGRDEGCPGRFHGLGRV